MLAVPGRRPRILKTPGVEVAVTVAIEGFKLWAYEPVGGSIACPDVSLRTVTEKRTVSSCVRFAVAALAVVANLVGGGRVGSSLHAATRPAVSAATTNERTCIGMLPL